MQKSPVAVYVDLAVGSWSICAHQFIICKRFSYSKSLVGNIQNYVKVDQRKN